MVSSTSFSIVIPNYNGEELLKKNLPSVLAAARNTQAPFEIIIADDASTDGSCTFIKKTYPDITLLENPVNKGFSSNINTGIYVAKNEWTLLLNSDIELDIDFIKNILQQIQATSIDNTAFGYMGLIKDDNSKQIIDAAKYPTYNLFTINGTVNYICTNSTQTLTPTMFLSGANAFVNTQKLKQLGAFNTLFSPFYYEDVELGIHSGRMGWKSYCVNNAICYHATSSTISKTQNKNTVKATAMRNKWLMHQLHLNNSALFFWKILLTLKIVFAFISNNKTQQEAYNEYKKLLPQLMVQKQQMRCSISVQEYIASLQKEIATMPIAKF